MIYGIGTDIVKVERLAKSLDRYGDKVARRILSDNEYQQFQRAGKPVHFLAKRFAAKEATAKAMGTGFRDGLSLRHISIENDSLGKPLLILTQKAEEWAKRNGIGDHFVSLSDEEEYAVAYVLLMKLEKDLK